VDCTYSRPYLFQTQNSWTKCHDTVMIGRVHYFVDSANNSTSTSTEYAQQVTYASNHTWVTAGGSDIAAGGSRILTRTDVNEAGTVTYMDGTNTM
jgi:hypothetical protein